MLWGHRNDPVNFHRCLQDFDRRLPDLLEALREGDLLLLTSDHGCDPTTPSTDHSREYALLLAYVQGKNAARPRTRRRVRGCRSDGERLARWQSAAEADSGSADRRVLARASRIAERPNCARASGSRDDPRAPGAAPRGAPARARRNPRSPSDPAARPEGSRGRARRRADHGGRAPGQVSSCPIRNQSCSPDSPPDDGFSASRARRCPR